MKKKAGPESTPLRMGGRILIDLSHGAYTSIATAIKEYISNGWDAGAASIRVVVYNANDPDKTLIQIVDDGSGMSRADLIDKFFRVGRDRRREEGTFAKTIRGRRRVHGRKGLGKLAGLKLANVLDVVTWTDSEVNAAWLDLGEVKESPNAEPQVYWHAKPKRPSGLGHTGTIITLKEYTRRGIVEMPDLAKHLCHWFEFGNDARVVLEDRKGDPATSTLENEYKIARSELLADLETESTTFQITWREGTEDFRKDVRVKWGWLDKSDTNVKSMISVLSGTRALSTEETFDISRGWTNMFGIYKLVAEFQADWLDEMKDADPADIKRESIDWHVHPALEALRTVGQEWLIATCRAHAASDRGKDEIRRKTESLVDSKPQFAAWRPDQKRQLVSLVASYASKAGLSTDQLSPIIDLFGFVLEHGALISFLQDLKESGKKDIDGFLELASEFSASEMTGLLFVTKHKLQLVKELQEIIKDPKTTEVPRAGRIDITTFLAESPWLFDPELRIDHVDQTMKRIVLQSEGESTATLNALPSAYFKIRPDFVGYTGPTSRPICMELKRPTWELTEDEAQRVIRYRAVLVDHPAYRGLRVIVVSGSFEAAAARLLKSQPDVELLPYADLLRRAHSQLDAFIAKLQGGLQRMSRAAPNPAPPAATNARPARTQRAKSGRRGSQAGRS